MASVVINGDTSGAVTITAPAVAGTPTLTLPTTTGTLATLTTPSFGTTIGVGGATASASGSGISFPATQSASSDANTLDDYEEGTFTPTIFGASTAGSTTYSFQNGIYTKIGRVVYFFVDVQWTAQSGTGDLTMGGLPFTCGSSIGQNNYSPNNLALSANHYTSLAQVNSSATTVNFYQNQTGGSALTSVPVDSSARIWMGGCYFI
jgi:hypothetical protein